MAKYAMNAGCIGDSSTRDASSGACRRAVQIDTPAKLCDLNRSANMRFDPRRRRRRSSSHVAGLGHRRYRARLYRAVVPGGELRRPPAHSAWKLGAAPHLPVIACDLLHVMDVLRFGRISVTLRL